MRHNSGQHDLDMFKWAWLCTLTLGLALLSHVNAAVAEAADVLDRQVTLDLPALTHLDDALIEWGVKAGATVMINTPSIDQRVLSHRIHCTTSARKALLLLLQDSGLSYKDENGRIQIVPGGALLSLKSKDALSLASANDGVGSANVNVESTDRQRDITEVIVTAQKREERIQ